MFIVIILIVMEIIAVYTAIISIIVFAKEDSGIRLDRAIFGIVLSLVPFAGILLVMIFQVWIRDKYNYHTDYIRLYYPGYTLLEAKTTNNIVRKIINWYINAVPVIHIQKFKINKNSNQQ